MSSPAIDLPVLFSIDHSRYGEYYNKFNSIFKLNPRIPVYYVPGNRDVGYVSIQSMKSVSEIDVTTSLGSSARFSSDMRSRYESYFGPTNQLIVRWNS